MPEAWNYHLLEVATIVNLFGAAAPSSSTAERFSMKGFERAAIIICQNKSAGNGSAISMNQSTDVSGSGAKALAFTKAFRSLANGNQAAPVNTWASFTVSANTFTTDATNSVRDMYMIDVKREDLDFKNDFDCVELVIGNAASNVIQAIAILLGARYGGFPTVDTGIAN
jgi:predicted outer membrane repeat protein